MENLIRRGATRFPVRDEKRNTDLVIRLYFA